MKKIILLMVLFVVFLVCGSVESARYQEELLSVTNIDLSQEGDTVIYQVPRLRHCILTKAVLVVGDFAGRSVMSIGEDGDHGDYIEAKLLTGLFSENDALILSRDDGFPPIESYGPKTLIIASVLTAEGGDKNKLMLYGILY